MLFFLLLCWLRSYSVHVRVYWVSVLVDLRIYTIMAKLKMKKIGKMERRWPREVRTRVHEPRCLCGRYSRRSWSHWRHILAHPIFDCQKFVEHWSSRSLKRYFVLIQIVRINTQNHTFQSNLIIDAQKQRSAASPTIVVWSPNQTTIELGADGDLL